ncbi:immunoglobulin-like domain-containing protein [Psychromonas sp. KJ10-10]|uniref:immunoglobulin-like domain-containing protein n=1 Tax=Psychromonas sp. KJ10-10 TaxID=3391823 RepID=UPI0039B64F2A
MLAGSTTATAFNVATVDDVYAEGDEVYSVSISNPQGGGVENLVLGTDTVATTIHDDKTPGT